MTPRNNQSYPNSNERIVYDIEPRLFDKIIVFLIILAGIFALLSMTNYSQRIELGLLGIYTLTGGYDIVKTWLTNYTVTDRKIMISSGILNRYTTDIHFDDVMGITVYSNFLSIGKGAIAIETNTNTNIAYKALQPGRGTRIKGITNHTEVGNYIRERCRDLGGQLQENNLPQNQSYHGQPPQNPSQQGRQQRGGNQQGKHGQSQQGTPPQEQGERQNTNSRRG